MTKPNLKIAVAFNEPGPPRHGREQDTISEVAVMAEVEAVTGGIQTLGHMAILLPVATIETTLKTVQYVQPDLIFNLCEGFQGDAHQEMHLTSLWELIGIPYTGNVPLTLGLSQNKVMAKELFRALGIPTPAYVVYDDRPKSCSLAYPVIAKPAQEDASLGITQQSIINNDDELQKQVGELLHLYRQPILVEEFIDGREFNVSVLGNKPCRCLPVSEISFTQLEAGMLPITSYEAKWLPDHPLYQKTPAVCPAEISEKLNGRLDEIAIQVYQALRGRDYGRVDFRVDKKGQPFVLEYNPNPDISLDAGYTKAIVAAGMLYQDFIETLIWEALNRHDKAIN